jgi:hypothetical protein
MGVSGIRTEASIGAGVVERLRRNVFLLLTTGMGLGVKVESKVFVRVSAPCGHG